MGYASDAAVNQLTFLHFLTRPAVWPARPSGLVALSYGLCQRLADDGTGYADVIFNPTHWHAWYGRLAVMLDAVDAGFRAAGQDGLPRVGVRVSVNTDDPALLGASLIGEYALCRRTFGWTDAITKSVAQTSTEANCASVDVKAQLLAALKDW